MKAVPGVPHGTVQAVTVLQAGASPLPRKAHWGPRGPHGHPPPLPLTAQGTPLGKGGTQSCWPASGTEMRPASLQL